MFFYLKEMSSTQYIQKLFNQPSIVEWINYLLLIIIFLFYSFIIRSWMNNWGTSKDELMQQFPGDSIIDTPNIVSTKSIRITAEPKQIWPWLVQMGQGQGGFYSYSRLQNLVGLKMKNADQIMPEYQDTAIGDLMKLSPQGGGEIVIMENNRALVLFADEKQMINPNIEESRFSTTWLFFIEHKGGGESKLYSRGRYKYKGILVSVMMRIFLEPITFVMERKMLKGIKRRVENTGIDNSVS